MNVEIHFQTNLNFFKIRYFFLIILVISLAFNGTTLFPVSAIASDVNSTVEINSTISYHYYTKEQ